MSDISQRPFSCRDSRAAQCDQSVVPVGSSAEQFRQFVRDEVAKSDRIVSQAGIRPE